VNDPTGEESSSFLLLMITTHSNALVTIADDENHFLGDVDYVRFVPIADGKQ
jgi:hypothetical protein